MFRSLSLSLMALALTAQTPSQIPPQTPDPAPKPVVSAPKPPVKKDKIIAGIDGRPVMESEFMTYLNVTYTPQQRMQIGMNEGTLERVQENYLKTRLLAAKARKDGLDKGLAYARKREVLEMDLLVQTLFQRDGAKLQEKSTVSDSDVKAYYEKNLAKFKTTETFTARQILIGTKESAAPDAKSLSEEAVKAKVAKVQETLKGGKKFEDVAKEFSDDPGSKESGGLYENIQFGSFVPEFEEAVRKQKIGEVGEPVKSQFGYHLIVVDKITPSEQKSFEATKEEARQWAMQERQEQVMEEFLNGIKKEIPYMTISDLAKKGKKPKPTAAGSN